jgi:Spy/CpxP family protein refolding chaperone
MEKSARTRLLTAVVLVAVFGAGVVLGMALHGGTPPTAASVASSSQDTDSAGRPRRQPLYMQVDPTDAQKAKLDSILKQNHDAMRALTREFHQEFDPRYDSLNNEYRAKYGPRYDSLIAGTRAAIRKVLTPEQVEKWDSLIAKADSARAEDRRRGDRGSGDRGSGDRGPGDRGSRDRD